MTNNEQKSHDLQHQIGSTNRRAIALFAAMQGLAHMRQKVEAQALAHVEHQASNICADCDPVSASNAISYSWARGSGTELVELAKLDAGISALENNPDFQAAKQILEPLCVRREELRALVAAEAYALAEAQSAAAMALAEAHERARLAAENDPQVRAAAERLASLVNPQPAPAQAPLIRGKIRVTAGQELAEDMH